MSFSINIFDVYRRMKMKILTFTKQEQRVLLQRVEAVKIWRVSKKQGQESCKLTRPKIT